MEEHCGGYNVSVEIFQFPTSLEWEPLKCKTKAWKYFKAGDTLIFDHKKAFYPCKSIIFIQCFGECGKTLNPGSLRKT